MYRQRKTSSREFCEKNKCIRVICSIDRSHLVCPVIDQSRVIFDLVQSGKEGEETLTKDVG